MKNFIQQVSLLLTIIGSSIIVSFLVVSFAHAETIGGVGTGTLTGTADGTVITVYVDETYTDAAAPPTYATATTDFGGVFLSGTAILHYVDDINGCYLTATTYSACIAGGGIDVGDPLGYNVSGGVWAVYVPPTPPSLDFEATSTVDQTEQNAWNAFQSFIAIVFLVLWLGRKNN
jgi:hypothetical protein